nr:lipase [Pseudomonadota bacterium]
MNRISAAALAACLLLSGCSDSDSARTTAPPVRSTFFALFDLEEGDLPFPINLLFSGSTDGTLNIPVAPPVNPANPTLALNALDGFSTIEPITVRFSEPVDAAAVTAGDSVRVFRVELANPFLRGFDPAAEAPFAVRRVLEELAPGVDYTALIPPQDPGQTTLVILPLRPLEPASGYLVVLTSDLHTPDGFAPVPPRTYVLLRGEEPLVDAAGNSRVANVNNAQAQALERLRPVVNSQEAAAAAQGIDPAAIVLSWTFLTQSIGDALAAVGEAAAPGAISVAGVVSGTAMADILQGSLTVPYFLDPAMPLAGRWRGAGGSELTRYNPQPVAVAELPIPLLVSVPNAASGQVRPAGGWPLVIFQHGITENRLNLLAIADALAAAGFAAVAIDLPLHGVTDAASPFFTPLERTFNFDLVNNATLAPGPDGQTDPTGLHFVNLRSALTTRDNLRQAAADLLQLRLSAPALDLDGDGDGDINGGRIHFVGHSLGAIVGIPYLALD